MGLVGLFAADVQPWVVAFGASLYWGLFTGLTYFAPMTLLGKIHVDLGVTVEMAALPSNLYKICLMCLLPVVGPILACLPIRPCMIVSVVVASVCGFLYPLAQTVNELIAINAIWALCTTFFGLPTLFSIVALWSKHGIGLAGALVIVGWSISGIVVPPFVAIFEQSGGWRAAMFSLAVIFAASAIPTTLFILQPPPDMARETDTKHGVKWIYFRMRQFWALAVVYVSMSWVIGTFFDHLSVFLTAERGMSLTRSALIMSVLNSSALFTKLIAGYAGDRFGASKVLCTGCVMALCAISCMLRQTTEVAFFIAFALMFGCGYACVLASMCTIIPGIFGIGDTVFIQSMMLSFYHFGSAAGSTAAGISVTRFSSYSPSFLVAIVMMGLCLPASLLLLRLEHEKQSHLVAISKGTFVTEESRLLTRAETDELSSSGESVVSDS
ncbi:hypothetical protein NDN08_006497 [Rhodosorus marinus]|uniref:Major facilitator superfamily (MFS) profile domain-containing protein n=1 Tax=Rhodosorus marinus TaxID=101924 RepID=A0AAV8UHX8_9RHOD|nr:hypothetical protein NDN08_006497 [Rhodosorus marinus]